MKILRAPNILVFALIFLLCTSAFAQDGDTTVVPTFTFGAQNDPSNAYDSPGRRWFNFPSSSSDISYQKILMYYTLKCFDDGTAGSLGYPCGEWDYLTYTYLYDHTGVIDSTLGSHPLYYVNNQDFDAAHLTSQPVSVEHEYLQNSIMIDAIVGDVTAEVGDSITNTAGPFSSSHGQRSLFLYRGEELLAAGVSSEHPIGKLSMFFSGLPADIRFLSIRFGLTTDDSLSGFYPDNIFNQAYLLDTNIPGDGWYDFATTNDFTWDGESNLLIEVSHTNFSGSETPDCTMDMQDYPCAFMTSGNDRYMKFDWQDQVKVPAEVFSDVSDQISISFWQYGDPASQPQEGTAFEGVNANNQRMLNSHLPWSNGHVYWDAGGDEGYDRIEKLAATGQYEGKWNHWCFTKNATTGIMKIFLNGVQWHIGGSTDNLMDNLARFSIGGAESWTNFYNGSMDEFAVFNVELDAATIQQWMSRDLENTHPFWDNLQVYYKFNEADGEMVADASGHDRNAWMHGNAARIFYNGNEMWRNGAAGNYRPLVRLTTGGFITHTEVLQHSWTEILPPVSVVQYAVEDHLPIATEVNYAWEEQDSFTITALGDTINEVLVPAEYTLNNEDFEYWQQPFEIVDRFELNRFITMYGIGLDLDEGWTWVTDVTDWAPLLRDSVELEAGNWQELLDLKFLFIEGPPAREVMRVEPLWDANVEIPVFDTAIVEKTVEKLPGEVMWKIATTATGHGFGADDNNCGEFCSNIHSVKVNGTEQWSWDILQECAANPLYPQGGTWIYDRAGWCPGMNSTTKEFELSPLVPGGEDFTLDYDVTYDPHGNYVFFTTLFAYGNPAHQHDPEIDQVLAPSNWRIHSRWNPVCDKAKFVLRNKGAAPLTDLNIYYGVEGGEMQAMHWTGDLGFMQSEEVELTYTDTIMWSGVVAEDLTFLITLGLSADGADENTSNNAARSRFRRPPVYKYPALDDNRMVIQLRTNASPQQSEYTLYDVEGDVIFHRDDFTLANTTYRDTIELNKGCYMFHLQDSEDDGLSFFANSDGNGNCKLDRVGGADFVNFNANFGKEIRHYFYFNTNLETGVKEHFVEKSTVKVMPNPASGSFRLDISGFDRTIVIDVYDVHGRLMDTQQVGRKGSSEYISMNCSTWQAGLYHLKVSDGQHITVVKMMKE